MIYVSLILNVIIILVYFKSGDKASQSDFINLKIEVDKLRSKTLKFKKGDYVVYNNVKCFISSINIDRYEGFSYAVHSPYHIQGPNISRYIGEAELTILKCKKEK